MTLPNFLIIGVGKAGTTSVYNYLRQHPDVFVSPIKEPHGGVTYLPPKTLTPRPENARTHSSKQLERLCAAIARFGFLNPILIDGKRRVIAGHARLEAARRLGLEVAPTLVLKGLSEAELRLYATRSATRWPCWSSRRRRWAASCSPRSTSRRQCRPRATWTARCQGLGMVKLTGLY